MRKNLLFLLSFFLTAVSVFPQQDIAKKIEKLKKKYEYVSKQSSKGFFLTAINSKTNNQTDIIYENIKIVDINGKVIKEKEFASYKFSLTIGDRYEYFPEIHNFIDANKKLGLITSDGDIILPPTYDRINHFNSKGQAIAFSGTNIQVINTSGKPLLEGNYKSNSDDNNLYWGISADEKFRYTVIDNNLICSIDEKHYGIVNVLSNKMVAPFEYDKICNEPIISDKDTIGYVAIKNNLSTILDFKTKKEIASFPFERIRKAFIYENSVYIEGYVNTNTNYYDVKNKKMIFSPEIKIDNARPYDQNFWEYNKDRIVHLYNLSNNQIVKTPEVASNVTRLTDNLALYNSNEGNSSWIFDVTKNKVVKKYSSNVGSYSFKLKRGTISKEYFFIKERKIANDDRTEGTTMYDRDLKTYFTDLSINTSYYENDRIVIKEHVDGKYPLTAYDIDGNVIGIRREYQMK